MIKFLKIILLLTLLGLLTYFVFPILKTRYFNHPSIPTETSLESKMNNLNNTPSDSTPSPDLNGTASDQNPSTEPWPEFGNSNTDKTAPIDPTTTVNLNERGTKDSQNLAHITTENCNNNCKAFAMDLKLLEYCQQVCGLVPIKDISSCDDKKSIERDYCLKDLAINKKDSKFCEPIKDANIRLTCQNRILEDALENQPAPTKLDF